MVGMADEERSQGERMKINQNDGIERQGEVCMRLGKGIGGDLLDSKTLSTSFGEGE